MNLKSRYGGVALITGASSGIGEAFARHIAGTGMDVILVARRQERLDQLASELVTDSGITAHVIVADLTDPNASNTIAARVNTLGLEVGLLINNAGFGVHTEFADAEPQKQLDMVDVNCRAVVDIAARFLPTMKARKQGGMVIVASALAYIPTPYYAVYSASKAFDLLFAEALYAECRSYGVDVLGMAPTYTNTEFQGIAGMNAMIMKPREAQDVVHTAFRALGKKASVVDGLKTQAALLLTRVLPRTWVSLISKRVMDSRSAK